MRKNILSVIGTTLHGIGIGLFANFLSSGTNKLFITTIGIQFFILGAILTIISKGKDDE